MAMSRHKARPSDVGSATYLSSGTPSRSHFALVKRLEDAAASPGGAHQHALDTAISSLARHLAQRSPSSDPGALCNALMPVAYLTSIGVELGKELTKAALLPTLQLLSSHTASAQQLHLAFGLLHDLLGRKGSNDASSEEEGNDDDDGDEASHSLLLLSTMTWHLSSSRPAILELCLRSIIAGLPRGADVLPALLGPVRSLARTHPKARCRARALEAWATLLRYEGDEGERSSAMGEIWDLLVLRLSSSNIQGVRDPGGRDAKGKGRRRENDSGASQGSMPLDPVEAAAALRLVERCLSNQTSLPATARMRRAAEAVQAVAALLKRIDVSFRAPGAKTPVPLLELCTRAVAKAVGEMSDARGDQEGKEEQQGSSSTANQMARSALGIWSTLILCAQARPDATSGPVSPTSSTSTLRSNGHGAGRLPSSSTPTTSATTQGQLLSVSLSLSSLLGSLHPLLPLGWHRYREELKGGLLEIRSFLRSLIARKNPNARLVCVKVLRALVRFGWAAGGGGGEARDGNEEQKGEGFFEWSAMLEERHWVELLRWTEAEDQVLRKETLRMLGVVDAGILRSYRVSLISRANTSSSSPSPLGPGEVRRLQCRALEVGMSIASAAHSSTTASPDDGDDDEAEARAQAVSTYVETLLDLLEQPEPSSAATDVGHLLAQCRADLSGAESDLASCVAREVLRGCVQRMKRGSQENEARPELILLCAMLAFEFPTQTQTHSLADGARHKGGGELRRAKIVKRTEEAMEHLCTLLASARASEYGTVQSSLLLALVRQASTLPSSASSTSSSARRIALGTVARLVESEQEKGKARGEVERVGSAVVGLLRDPEELRAFARKVKQGDGLIEGREKVLDRGRRVGGRGKVAEGGDEGGAAEKGGVREEQRDSSPARLGPKSKSQSKRPLRYAAYDADDGGDSPLAAAAAAAAAPSTAPSNSTTSAPSPAAGSASVFLASRNVGPPPAPSSREAGRAMRMKRREEERVEEEVRIGMRRLLIDDDDEDEGGREREGVVHEDRRRVSRSRSIGRGRERGQRVWRSTMDDDDREGDLETRQGRSDSLTSRPDDLILFDADLEDAVS